MDRLKRLGDNSEAARPERDSAATGAREGRPSESDPNRREARAQPLEDPDRPGALSPADEGAAPRSDRGAGWSPGASGGERPSERGAGARPPRPDPDATAPRSGGHDSRAEQKPKTYERVGERRAEDGGGRKEFLRGFIDRYGATPDQRRSTSSGDNTVALLAVALGIAALAMLLLTSGGLFFLALPLGIVAVVLGVRGKRRVDRGASTEHRAAAKTGVVLGVASIVLSLVVVALLALGAVAIGKGLQGLERASDRRDREQLRQREELQRRGLEQREELQRRARERQESRQ